jgi:Family of unknown function (DUF6090)
VRKNPLNSFFSGIDWKNQFVSVIVVFLGISTAFYLDNWNEGIKKRKLENEYLSALMLDLEEDIFSIEEALDTSKFFLEENNKLLKVLYGQKESSDSVFFYMMSLYSFSTFHPHDNTYRSMMASGNLSLVRDFHLRQGITKQYNQHFQSLTNFDEIHQEFIRQKVWPLVYENIRFSPINPGLIDAAFLDDDYFSNIAHASNYYIYTKINIYEETLKNAIILLSEIEEKLK